MKSFKYILLLCHLCLVSTACGSDGTGSSDNGVVTDITLGVTPLSVNAGVEGGKYDISVNASREWSAFVTGGEQWLSVTPASGMSGQATVSIQVKANATYEPRQAEVTVKAGTERQFITIQQAAAERPVVDFSCPVEGYNLVWHDEFDGTELNTADWSYEVQKDHWVNNELQNYVAGQTPGGASTVSVKDGILSITARQENGKVYSGRIYAKKSTGWKYAYIEASICLPKGKGTWPAFWMMPVKFKSWPHDGEIDIMEEVGANPDYVSSSLHADGHVHSNNTQWTHEMYCKGAEGEFHKYAIEWEANRIRTYVDGKLQIDYSDPGNGVRDWPYTEPFYVILNLAWGGDWGGYRGVDNSALPVTMQVDYVRVWQKD